MAKCCDEAKFAPSGGKRRSAFETGLVQQVDRWRSAATERDDMLEPFRGLDGLDQSPSDSAARADDDCHSSLGKRPGVRFGDSCGVGLASLSHRGFAPLKTD